MSTTQGQQPAVDPQTSHLMDLGFRPPANGGPQPTTQEPTPAPGNLATAPAAPPPAPVAEPTPATAPPITTEPAPTEAPKAPKFTSFTNEPTAPMPWTDEAKNILKSRGIDDPDNYLKEFNTYREQVELLRKENESGSQLANEFNGLDDVYKELFRKATAGEDALAWARTLPSADLTKEASKIDPIDLVYNHCRHAFTDDQWNTLRNPKDADEEELKTLQRILPNWVKVATPLHDNARKEIIEGRANEQKVIQERGEKLQRSIAANAAYAKEKHPEFLPDQNQLSDFASGKMFNEQFFESDGFTPKPSAYSDLQILKNFKEILQDVKEAALEQGRNEARLRGAMRGPATPPGGSGTQQERVLTNEEKQQEDHLNSLRPQKLNILQQ